MEENRAFETFTLRFVLPRRLHPSQLADSKAQLERDFGQGAVKLELTDPSGHKRPPETWRHVVTVKFAGEVPDNLGSTLLKFQKLPLSPPGVTADAPPEFPEDLLASLAAPAVTVADRIESQLLQPRARKAMARLNVVHVIDLVLLPEDWWKHKNAPSNAGRVTAAAIAEALKMHDPRLTIGMRLHPAVVAAVDAMNS